MHVVVNGGKEHLRGIPSPPIFTLVSHCLCLCYWLYYLGLLGLFTFGMGLVFEWVGGEVLIGLLCNKVRDCCHDHDRVGKISEVTMLHICRQDQFAVNKLYVAAEKLLTECTGFHVFMQ